MPTITQENIDALNAILTVNLHKDDYLNAVENSLKDYRKKGQMKGFRPGKIPMSLIKRRYGNAVMAEKINEIVGENINKYFNENKIKVLGQPLAIADNQLSFNIMKPEDFVLKFEMGLAPEFEIKGLNEDTKLDFYEIAVSKTDIDSEIENVRKKFSNGFEEGVKDIIPEDMLTIKLEELDESGNLKTDGVVKEETYLALRDVVDKKVKDDLLSATVNDSIDVNIFKVEDKDKNYIRKHILSIKEDTEVNEQFRLTIKEIKRVKKAELNEDFFNKVFPQQNIQDLDAFRSKVEEEINGSYVQSAKNQFQNLVFDFLIEHHDMDFPEDFLQKWLKESNQELTDEFFEGNDFKNFLRNLKWSLIREKLAEKYQVNVEFKEIEDMTRNEILRYFNYQIPAYGDMIDGMLQKILSDKNEVNKRFEMIMDQKVLEQAAGEMGKSTKQVDKEKFEEILKNYKEEREQKMKNI